MDGMLRWWLVEGLNRPDCIRQFSFKIEKRLLSTRDLSVDLIASRFLLIVNQSRYGFCFAFGLLTQRTVGNEQPQQLYISYLFHVLTDSPSTVSRKADIAGNHKDNFDLCTLGKLSKNR